MLTTSIDLNPTIKKLKKKKMFCINANFLSLGSENSENQKRDIKAEKLTKKCHDLPETLIVNISGYKQYFLDLSKGK